MRRALIVTGVTLLAALGAACGSSETAPGLVEEKAAISTPESAGRAEPGLATLVISGNEQIAGLGSYCWRHEDGSPLCLDTIGIPTVREALSAGSPFTALLRLPDEQPVTESLLYALPVTLDDQLDSEARGLRWWRPDHDAGERFTLPVEHEAVVELSLEPGLYVLSLSARFDFPRFRGRGDAAFGFLVDVR